jgi:predicted nucleotidyltransferase
MSISKLWAAIQSKWNITDIPVEEHLRNTKQDHLPQAKLLVETLHHLEDNLTEAYLRGSFAYGEADERSDIDLFVVVSPEKLEETYNSFVEFLNEDYSVLVFCHDRLVKDYGGIGFMFIVKDDNDRLFQFDFYMAMTGVPPKVGLSNHPRIYTQNPEYCWLEENKPQPLPKDAQDFIDRATGKQNDVSKGSEGNLIPQKRSINAEIQYQLTDLMVALNIMKKHVARGQNARTLVDNNHVTGTCVEMLKALMHRESPHTALYEADSLIKTCTEQNRYADKARRLDDLMLQPPGNEKIVKILKKVNHLLWA